MRRLLDLGAKFFELGSILVADAIDEWTTGETHDKLRERIRENAERAAELALENARIREELEELRLDGPSLWCEEVELLNGIAVQLDLSIKQYQKSGRETDGLARDLKTIRFLLDRCNHLPVSSSELSNRVEEIIRSVAREYDSDDLGNDIDGG